jgi:transposase
MLTDELWSQLKGILRQLRIYDKPFLRDMVEGMLYRMRVGCPWRDIPNEFGCWNTIFQKFNRWSAKKKFMIVFKMLVHEPDLEWEFIDGSIVKAHQHSAGAASNEEQGIGKSVAGNTTKIHMAADAYGLPIDFEITGGEVHDCKNAPEFIRKLPSSDYLIADKGYDNEILREQVRNKLSVPIIPRKNNSLTGNFDIDWSLYKHRHLIENLFARLKHFRSIATRYDKLKRNFVSMLALACSYLWLPM